VGRLSAILFFANFALRTFSTATGDYTQVPRPKEGECNGDSCNNDPFNAARTSPLSLPCQPYERRIRCHLNGQTISRHQIVEMLGGAREWCIGLRTGSSLGSEKAALVTAS